MAELRGRSFVLLAVGVLLAIAINLVFCRWGVDLAGSSMLTWSLQDDRQATPDAFGAMGLYTAPWMAQRLVLAWILGIVVPILVVIAAVAGTWRPRAGKMGS